MGKSEPKILIWDLEIIPDLKNALKYWTQLSNQYHSGQTLKADVTSVCTFGYKWFGEGKAKTINAWDFPEWEEDVNDDRNLCKAIYKILSEADYWVYQNGDWFDKRWIFARLKIHRLPALPAIKSADTKKLAKKDNLILSNSLNHQAEIFTDVRKLKHGEGWDLWIDTHNRKKKAMKLMSKYCKHDVLATEELFKVHRPSVKNMPNYNVYSKDGKIQCHNCGSERFKRWGTYPTKTKLIQRLFCKDCNTTNAVPANLIPRSI